MSNIKFYTEEQVRQAFIDGMKLVAVHPLKYEQDANEYIDSLTPIELLTDEEIEEKFDTKNEKYYIFLEGARWMKDKILNK